MEKATFYGGPHDGIEADLDRPYQSYRFMDIEGIELDLRGDIEAQMEIIHEEPVVVDLYARLGRKNKVGRSMYGYVNTYHRDSLAKTDLNQAIDAANEAVAERTKYTVSEVGPIGWGDALEISRTSLNLMWAAIGTLTLTWVTFLVFAVRRLFG